VYIRVVVVVVVVLFKRGAAGFVSVSSLLFDGDFLYMDNFIFGEGGWMDGKMIAEYPVEPTLFFLLLCLLFFWWGKIVGRGRGMCILDSCIV